MKNLWLVIDADYRKYPYDAVDGMEAMNLHRKFHETWNPRALNVQGLRRATRSDFLELQSELSAAEEDIVSLESRLSDIAEEG